MLGAGGWVDEGWWWALTGKDARGEIPWFLIHSLELSKDTYELVSTLCQDGKRIAHINFLSSRTGQSSAIL